MPNTMTEIAKGLTRTAHSCVAASCPFRFSPHVSYRPPLEILGGTDVQVFLQAACGADESESRRELPKFGQPSIEQVACLRADRITRQDVDHSLRPRPT